MFDMAARLFWEFAGIQNVNGVRTCSSCWKLGFTGPQTLAQRKNDTMSKRQFHIHATAVVTEHFLRPQLDKMSRDMFKRFSPVCEVACHGDVVRSAVNKRFLAAIKSDGNDVRIYSSTKTVNVGVTGELLAMWPAFAYRFHRNRRPQSDNRCAARTRRGVPGGWRASSWRKKHHEKKTKPFDGQSYFIAKDEHLNNFKSRRGAGPIGDKLYLYDNNPWAAGKHFRDEQLAAFRQRLQAEGIAEVGFMRRYPQTGEARLATRFAMILDCGRARCVGQGNVSGMRPGHRAQDGCAARTRRSLIQHRARRRQPVSPRTAGCFI